MNKQVNHLCLLQLKLVNPSSTRFEHLVTQMKWRLQEGQGEAIYEIGVEDNGIMVGLSKDELESSLNTLNTMASRLGANTTMLRHRLVTSGDENPPRQVAEVLVRRVAADQQVSLHCGHNFNRKLLCLALQEGILCCLLLIL